MHKCGKVISNVASVYSYVPEYLSEEEFAVKSSRRYIPELKGFFCIKTQLINNDFVTILRERGLFYYVQCDEQLEYMFEIKQLIKCEGWLRAESIEIVEKNEEYVDKDDEKFLSLNDNTIRSLAYGYLDSPYLWGGLTKNGIDCSGLTYMIYKNLGINLPRFSHGQYKLSTKVTTENLKIGDLIFLEHNDTHKIVHVSMYIGNDLMIESSGLQDVYRVRIISFNDMFGVSLNEISTRNEVRGKSVHFRRIKTQ